MHYHFGSDPNYYPLTITRPEDSIGITVHIAVEAISDPDVILTAVAEAVKMLSGV